VPNASPPDETPSATSPADENETLKRRMTTVFGWVGGGSLGLLVKYGLFLAGREGHPPPPTPVRPFPAGSLDGMTPREPLQTAGRPRPGSSRAPWRCRQGSG